MSSTLELLEKVMAKKASRGRPVGVITDARPSVSDLPQRPGMIKPVRDNTLAYAQRHRGEWTKPEYDFDRIQIAQDVDSNLGRSIRQRIDRFVTAGYEFVSENEDALYYIKQRFAYMEIATNKSFLTLQSQIFQDLVRYDNALLVKNRDNERSLGVPRKHHTLDIMIEPVAGYFIAPWERLEFKSNANGTFKSVRETMPDGKYKEYNPKDIIHFTMYRKPGFTVATPINHAALDDILLLRRIEEQVSELIETNLFPRFHYKVGTDDHPAMNTIEGVHEIDHVRDMIGYMPPGAVYVSDHRQTIEAIGSENSALRIDYYLNYFRQRVFAAIGSNDVDMGIGSSANRSTASALSKQTLLAVEAYQQVLSDHINAFMINELLIEGGFNPLDPAEKVKLRYGVVDKEERIALENQVIQKFTNNVMNLVEARAELGYRPPDEEWFDNTFFKLFAEPLALVQAGGGVPGSAAGQALAEMPQSNITPEAVKKEAQYAERQTKIAKAQPAGKKGGSTSKKTSGTSSNKSRPANQHGRRAAPKLTKDLSFSLGDREFVIPIECPEGVNQKTIDCWTKSVISLYHDLQPFLDIKLESVIRNQLPQLTKLHEELNGTK
jgi:hypothetical protein